MALRLRGLSAKRTACVSGVKYCGICQSQLVEFDFGRGQARAEACKRRSIALNDRALTVLLVHL